MSFSLLHKCVAYLLSGLGLFALSLGSELSEITLALVFVAFCASWFVEDKLVHRPNYAALWTAAVVAFLGLQVMRGLLTEPTLAMAIEFAAFLQISRLCNRRTAVDYQQIAVLAFLHLIAATVLSTNLSYAVLFVGFVIATPWMLALSHLRREIEGNYPAQADADPSARVAIRRVLASRRVVGPRFLLGTALLSLPLFAMTLTIFVTIPRVGQGFLTFQRQAGQRVAGFGNQVELGGFGVIRDDPTVVLRVTPQPAVDQKAPRLSLRLRGTSFDRYDGRRWTRSPGASMRMPRVPPYAYAIHRPPEPGRDKELRIVLDHLEEPVVFLPEGTVAVAVPPRVAGAESRPRPLYASAGLDVRYDRPDGLGLVYTAYVGSDPREASLPAIGDEQRSGYLQLPAGHERIAQLARAVAGSAESDGEKALRIERYLKQGRFTYSLKQPEVGDRLPLEVFLFEARRGHCEYYSSAMAVMLRTLGVPARNVTGFVGGQYNPYGGYYALRQGDAHSWVEVYQRGRGWVTYDPTPSSRAAVGPELGLWANVGAMIDALRTRWNTSVVGYDLRTQIGLLRKLASWAESRRRPDESGRGAGERGLRLREKWKPVLRWGAAVLVALVFGWLALRTLRSGPRDATASPRSKHGAQLTQLYRELERALAKRGHPRPPAATPLEHARTLARQGFAQHGEVELVTRSYMEGRYGGRPLRAAEVVELRQAIARVRRPAA
jgi:transglutaminase-like putative cysteine protease